jgi:hypothetical protein
LKYYIELFWPREPEASGREFALWYYPKKENRAKKIHIGDRFLLYETGRHPDHADWRGHMTVFASVTVVSNPITVSSEGVTIVGGKKWNIKIPIKVALQVNRSQGVEWRFVREALGWSDGSTLRSGPFEIGERRFSQIEEKIGDTYDDRDEFLVGEDPSYTEGQRVVRTHWAYERDRNAVNEAKRRMKSKYGKLFCEICNFSFEDKYGSLGKGVIDVHHMTPICASATERITKVSDLITICSNCHRIVHSKRPPFSKEEIQTYMTTLRHTEK